MANTQTLRELATPDLTHQPLCITFPTLAENTSFELKSGLIQLLPSFHGLSGEEPHKHVKEFEIVCSSMKPPGVTEEQIRLRAFPFSLKDAAKDCLRKEICSIKQYSGESLYDFWERFNKLCARCPQHQISEQLLIQYFYEGLQSTDRSIIDAASGGALANKTPREAWDLIEAMAENSQQFGFRESNPTRRINEAETSSIQQQLSELTSAVRQLAMRDTPRAKVCGICTSMDHCTDSCPILQEDGAEQVNMAGGVPAPRRQYDPYSNTYNSGWRDHPNLSYGNRQQGSFPNRPPGFHQPWQPKSQPSSSNSGSSLEDLVKSLATTTTQLHQEIKADKKDQEARISQLATAINRLESHVYGKLPSQPEVNPKNVSAMTLRSGKELEGLEKTKRAEREKEILDVFRKVQVNIPLLDVIKQVPKYAKFLKDLCVNKRKLRGDERVIVGENVSAVLQRKLPPKCGDPGPLKETGIIIQLTDRTCAYPDGIIEDVLVQSVFAIYATNPSVQEFSKFACRGKFKVAANKSYGMKAIHEVKMERKFREKVALNGHVDPGGRKLVVKRAHARLSRLRGRHFRSGSADSIAVRRAHAKWSRRRKETFVQICGLYGIRRAHA
ncbi:uncharacterized protein LOC113766775 [Coffea eugenioides]|uniref:uncharacterized protein LOC113766775 n=1 Tax=Coffea eugenioides TaxID=49369 RepID=UPI000F607DFC|nr:uncharacterized protein LOC113766775 [Coffea eugenioides]